MVDLVLLMAATAQKEINGEEEVTRSEPVEVSSTMSLTYSDFLYPQPQLTEPEVVDIGIGSFVDSLSQGHYLNRRGSTSNSSRSASSNRVSYLPDEFQVIQEPTPPLLQNLEAADHDFVIIAEFSEIEGPIPICTIPSNAPEKTDINLNSLAVHLMSTDYQVNTVGQFGICEDTHVLRTNIFQGVHVAMHYFTLYDIKARGFVRPFCFGYISKDHIKLDRTIIALLEQFNEITRVLKYTNRVWFASELTQYLNKLNVAKEEFIERMMRENEGKISETAVPDGSEVDTAVPGFSGDISVNVVIQEDDSETISLNQIAQQYSEIQNIFQTIQKSLDEPNYIEIGANLEEPYLSPDSKLGEVFSRLGLFENTFQSLDIPLVHPLKQKAESLRPMTTLGQLGTVILVQNLIKIYEANRQDSIFTELDMLTQDFKSHFRLAKQNSQHSVQGRVDNRSCDLFVVVDEAKEEEICRILETVHASVPIVAVDNKSASYHSLSTEESEVASSTPGQMNGDDSSFATPMGSVESIPFKTAQPDPPTPPPPMSSSSSPSGTGSSSNSNSPRKPSPLQEFLCRSDMNSSWTIVESRQAASEEVGPLRIPTIDEEPIEIHKVHWWTYAAKTKLVKGDPGCGLRKFWIQFSKIAHHLFYSILLGRPIIFFGSSKYRGKVTQIINSLVPLVPCPSSPTFKILHWHQGILVPNHLSGKFKLIGLCIPERLTIHDLLNSRDQNTVTLLDVEKKHISGPAYSGTYLKAFETLSVQKKFLNDLSLLTHLGAILTDIETQVYMCRCLQDEKGGSSLSKILKKLKLKNSDLEIVKHLSTLVTEVEDAMNIF